MPEQPEHSNLKEEYASRVDADLERNEEEQERINSELSALQTQLAALKEDHKLLQTMRGALGAERAAQASGTKKSSGAATPKAAAVPKARRAKDTAPRAVKAKTGSRKTAKAPTKAKAPAGTKAPAKAGKRTGPTLRELVHGHLRGQSEPSSVAEVTSALEKQHPQRTFHPTAVRTALETLAAQGSSERIRQQKSVYYAPIRNESAAEQPAETAAQSS
ncbi:hypothetical protein [Streptomyces sp. bgisy100]|uniref:hypothetical protein n=1 Tax=Streptomyces sp. bgisy100 TaxID=3413783 RepID=UPI003D73206F